jgi:IrrE N-terminal-like domain
MKLLADFDDAYAEIEAGSHFLPFINGEASRIELCALAAKACYGAPLAAPLDPWKAAEQVGVILRGQEYLDGLAPEIRGQILGEGSAHWSAGTLVCPPHAMIILNPTHAIQRQRLTLAEELAHLAMGHPPSSIDPELGIRTHSQSIEEEAYGVGGAMLLPYRSLFNAVKSRDTEEAIAARHSLSVRFVRYRINRTGLRNMYRKRSQPP